LRTNVVTPPFSWKSKLGLISANSADFTVLPEKKLSSILKPVRPGKTVRANYTYFA